MKRVIAGVVGTLLMATVPGSASAAPRIQDVSDLSAKRVDADGEVFYAMSAVVRLSEAASAEGRRRLGLVTVQWANRDDLRVGAELPDELFGGTGLGSVGKKARHCYRAEVASFKPWRSVRAGSSWAIALHDGQTVLRTASRAKLRVKASEQTLIEQAGCR